MNWAEHVAATEIGKQGFPIVQVCWKDAVQVAMNWETEVSPELRRTTTIGYLVEETDEALVLVAMINSEHVGHGVVIPKGCITRRATIG